MYDCIDMVIYIYIYVIIYIYSYKYVQLYRYVNYITPWNAFQPARTGNGYTKPSPPPD